MPGRARRNGSADEPCRAGVDLGPLVQEVRNFGWDDRALEELRFGFEIRSALPLSPDGCLKLVPRAVRYEQEPGGRHDGVGRAPSFTLSRWTCDGARRANAI